MRTREYLNGEWDFMPDFHNRTPDELIQDPRWESQTVSVPSSWRWSSDPLAEFQPYDLFEYPLSWNEAQSGLLRRTFRAGPLPPGRRTTLVIEAVLQRSLVYLNGSLICSSSEAYLPLRMDVTALLRPGAENELLVWCGPFESVPTPTGKKVLAPNGSWFAQLARGIWQDVYLEYHAAAHIQTAFVKTSTRAQSISIQALLANAGPEPGEDAILRAVIRDGDAQVKVLESGAGGLLAAGQTLEVVLQDLWPDALEWSPANPHLYTAQLSLWQAGQVVDEIELRFGFREVWTEAHKFYLNGKRINLRGDAWHYQGFVQQTRAYAQNWYLACRAAGINFVRLHAMPYPPLYLDVADEMGMLIIDESAIYGSSKITASDHPDFLERCHEHLRGLVLRDRNHPSVIIWSMQNEMRWVDGRDGYREAMPGLTAAMKALDDTRPVSYDGDNRLVDPDQMEIVSMHYNIDGTVASWKKDRPLIFGEHGPWHYVSPQTCSALGGPPAYLDYDACEEAIGLNERLFIEYARREEVTGQCPFNTANYAMWTLPDQTVRLEWADPSAPGPKPKKIPAQALTIHNGLVPTPELFRRNPSWKHLSAGFQPIAIFRNEYDHSFYGGRDLPRSFSIYNDTEQPAQARLEYRFSLLDGRELLTGQTEFEQAPGSRHEWAARLPLPALAAPTQAVLELNLYHSARPVCSAEFRYPIYPPLARRVDWAGRRVALAGGDDSFAALSSLAGPLERLSALTPASLAGIDLLILGKNFDGKAALIQPALEAFVRSGGSLLVLEQDEFCLGDLTLADRSFFAAFASDFSHPLLEGLAPADLQFWQPGNIHAPQAGMMIRRAFNKPVNGDVKILLECGAGDFGWGGLLWTPLLEYRLGAGKVILNQLDLLASLAAVPQAAILLGNLLGYAAQPAPVPGSRPGLLAEPASPWSALFPDALPLDLASLAAGLALPAPLIVDPAALEQASAALLHSFVEQGGSLLVLPARPEHARLLSVLAGREVGVQDGEVYQVRHLPHPLTASISDFELDAIEKVTYTPGTYQNRVLCSHCLSVSDSHALLQDVQNPWVEFFVRGHDDEYRKVALATLNRAAPFQPSAYGLLLGVGTGRLVLSQVLPLAGSEKVTRYYQRLLSNLGGAVATHLLSYTKDSLDYGIEAMMALVQAEHQDAQAMLAYFSAPDYSLNNLGEGVYGWMKRVEKRAGYISVPDSAHQTFFLTTFVDSALNRDPSRRFNNVLPDPSLVPDLFLDLNCAFTVFINGQEMGSQTAAPQGVLKIEDAILRQGLNRIALVLRGGDTDIRLSAWFKDKFGEPLAGLKYSLTID